MTGDGNFLLAKVGDQTVKSKNLRRSGSRVDDTQRKIDLKHLIILLEKGTLNEWVHYVNAALAFNSNLAIEVVNQVSLRSKSPVPNKFAKVLEGIRDATITASIGTVKAQLQYPSFNQIQPHEIIEMILKSELAALLSAVINVSLLLASPILPVIVYPVSSTITFAHLEEKTNSENRVPRPSLSDPVFVTLWPVNYCASAGRSLAKETSHCLHFVRKSSCEDSNRSFLFLFLHHDVSPLEMEKVFCRFRNFFEEASVWAKFAADHLEKDFVGLGLERNGSAFRTGKSQSWFILLSWGEVLHNFLTHHLDLMFSNALQEKSKSHSIPPIPPLLEDSNPEVSNPVKALCPPKDRFSALVGMFFEDFRGFLQTSMKGSSILQRILKLLRCNARKEDLRADMTGWEKLEAMGIRFCEETKGLYADIQYLEHYGFHGQSVLSIAQQFFRRFCRFGKCSMFLGDDMDLCPGVIVLDAEPEESLERREVHVSFCKLPTSLSDRTTDFFLHKLPDVPPGHTRLYHGASIVDATKILCEGISSECLNSVSDFGRAFYMTENLACALHYMQLTMESEGFDGAILVFDVDTGLYNKLDDVEEVDSNQEDRTAWQNLVRGCRREDPRKYMKDATLLKKFRISQVVRGPIVANADEIDMHPIATQVPVTPDGLPFPWQQVAFRDGYNRSEQDEGVYVINPRNSGSIVKEVHVLRCRSSSSVPPAFRRESRGN